jgi:hypothetical protein
MTHTPLAVRTLKVPQGAPAVRLEMDHPSQDAEGEWVCKFRIWADDSPIAEDEAVGSDAFAAIVSAMAGLKWHFERKELKGRWHFDAEGTGLPSYLPEGMGKDFDQKIRDMVAGAVAERHRALEAKNGLREGQE